MQHIKRNGVHYIVNGAGGYTPDSSTVPVDGTIFAQSTNGCLRITAEDDHTLSIHMYNKKGTKIHMYRLEGDLNNF